MAPKLEKNKNLLYACIAVAAILVILGAVMGYLYLDDQNKQNQKREELKQAFSDKRNETDRLYTLIGSYPAASNKNYLDDFRKWVDGYLTLADNYSQAVNLLVADGEEYRKMLGEGTDEYMNVSAVCSNLNKTVKSVNATATGYEKEYQSRLGLKSEACANYDLAVNRSLALYDAAWKLMQDSANFQRYSGYHAYLIACEKNNTDYNDSVGLVQDMGAIYQAYLKGSEYYAINTTILGLQDKSGDLGKKYIELSKTKPLVILLNEEVNDAWSADKGFYKAVSFVLDNENRKNGTLPMKIWNVVVHYTLIDLATGAVRDACDVPVTVTDYYMTDVHTAILKCDPKKDYRTEYTISFEY